MPLLFLVKAGLFIYLKKNKVKNIKKKNFKHKKGRQNYLTESDLYNRILFISKLKLENLFRNAEKIDFIFDVTYVMKLLHFIVFNMESDIFLSWNQTSFFMESDIVFIMESDIFLSWNQTSFFMESDIVFIMESDRFWI